MRSRALLLVLALVLCASCRHVRLDPNRVYAQFTHEEAAFLHQDLKGGLFRFFAQLHGPNTASMTRVVWELDLDGKALDHGETPVDRPFGADGNADLELLQKVTYAPDAAALVKLAKQRNVELTLKGEVQLAQGAKVGAERFVKSLKVPAPHLLEAMVDKADGARFSTGEVQVAFVLAVRNPNDFAVPLDEVPYSGMLAGKTIDQGIAASGVLLPAGATARFPISVYLDAPERSAEAVAHESSAPYRLRGALRGELYKVPFDLTGKVSLRRGD